jgi:hypothetical protein
VSDLQLLRILCSKSVFLYLRIQSFDAICALFAPVYGKNCWYVCLKQGYNYELYQTYYAYYYLSATATGWSRS